ncbi:sensor domain-containing protein [Paenibacillus sepulcri]
MTMKKQNAVKAWKMLVMALPKGIAAFVVAIVGLSVGLPLLVILIGLPLLSATLVLCRRFMKEEASYTKAWLNKADHHSAPAVTEPVSGQKGWLALLSPFREGQSYRGIVYSILQLPIGIAAFTTAIVLPVTAFAVMLSPLAYEVSIRLFDFNLFPDAWMMDRLNIDLSSAQRSWIAGGVGLIFVLLQPMILRNLGRWYASWVQNVAGPEAWQHQNLGEFAGDEMTLMADEAREIRLHA